MMLKKLIFLLILPLFCFAQMPTAVVDTITGFNSPIGIALTPNGAYAYVANNHGNSISVIATATNSIVMTIPVQIRSLVITPNGQYVYVSNSSSDSVNVIATATNTVVATIPGFDLPYGIAITPDGAYLYVTNDGNNSVSVIATATNTVIATIPVQLGPDAIAITPNGKYAYVTNQASASVSVIATATNMVIATVPVQNTPFAVAITPNGQYVYVINTGSGSISVIATATNTVIKTVTGFIAPLDIAFTSNGQYAYLLNGNNVSILGELVGEVTSFYACETGSYFLTQTDFSNLLTWQAPTNGLNGPVSYQIYRDAGLTMPVATVQATSTLQFVDHNRTKGVVYSYYITATDAYNNISLPVAVSVIEACA